MYKLIFAPERALLTIILSGFWTLEHCKAFQEQVRDQRKTIHRLCEQYSVLTDLRDFRVQSQDVAAAMDQFAKEEHDPRIGRVALLVTTVLSKRQADRVAAKLTTRSFQDQGKALAWLLEDERLTE